MPEPIIRSMLDTDLYKLTMQKCVWNQYPDARVKYAFKCRNENIKLGFLSDLVAEQVQLLSEMCLSDEEAQYLDSFDFFSEEYINYLRTYRFCPQEVSVNSGEGGALSIEFEGPWHKTILWEVQILAIVNQLYFQERSDFRSIQGEGIRRLKDKINLIRQYPTLTFAEFGTRRRYSQQWQQ